MWEGERNGKQVAQILNSGLAVFVAVSIKFNEGKRKKKWTGGETHDRQ
jgi:hypothetical protein